MTTSGADAGRPRSGGHVALRPPRQSGGTVEGSEGGRGSGFIAGSQPQRHNDLLPAPDDPSIPDPLFMREGVAQPHDGFVALRCVASSRVARPTPRDATRRKRNGHARSG